MTISRQTKYLIYNKFIQIYSLLLMSIKYIHRVTEAPRIMIKAPRIMIKAPRIMIKAPQIMIKAPRIMTKAPRIITNAPRIVIKAPRIMIKAPRIMIKAPRIMTKAPRIMTNAPRIMIKAPRIMTKAPRTMIKAPRIPMKAPRITIKALCIMIFDHLRQLWLSIKTRGVLTAKEKHDAETSRSSDRIESFSSCTQIGVGSGSERNTTVQRMDNRGASNLHSKKPSVLHTCSLGCTPLDHYHRPRKHLYQNSEQRQVEHWRQ